MNFTLEKKQLVITIIPLEMLFKQVRPYFTSNIKYSSSVGENYNWFSFTLYVESVVCMMNYLDPLKNDRDIPSRTYQNLEIPAFPSEAKEGKRARSLQKTNCKLSTIADLFLRSNLCAWLFNREPIRCYHKATKMTYRFLQLPCYHQKRNLSPSHATERKEKVKTNMISVKSTICRKRERERERQPHQSCTKTFFTGLHL